MFACSKLSVCILVLEFVFLVTRSADYIVTDYIDFLSHWIILSTDLFNYTDSFRSESLNNSLNQPIQVFRWTGLQLQHPSDKDIWKWMDRFVPSGFLQERVIDQSYTRFGSPVNSGTSKHHCCVSLGDVMVLLCFGAIRWWSKEVTAMCLRLLKSKLFKCYSVLAYCLLWYVV